MSTTNHFILLFITSCNYHVDLSNLLFTIWFVLSRSGNLHASCAHSGSWFAIAGAKLFLSIFSVLLKFLYLSHYAPPFWQKVLFWFSVKINTFDLGAYNKSLVTTMGGYWVKTNSETIQGIKLFKNKLFQAQGGQQGELFGSLSCPRRSNKCHQKHEYQGATLLLLKYKQTHQKD